MGRRAFSAVKLALALAATMGVAIMPTEAADLGLPQAISTDFSLKLFRHEAGDNSKNVLVSPFSAYEALSMTANGAGGNTLAQMAKVLGYTPSTMDVLNSRNHEVLLKLNSNSKVQMEIANAIFADAHTKFKPEFIALCARVYQAEARSENFADPQTVKKINDWCDAKTHGKIKEILQKLTPDEKMVLLNSVYFKGAWESAFKPDATSQQAFKLLSGATRQVPMMHKSLEAGYLKYKNMQAICLPYAGKKQMMYIFLPDAGTDFAAFKSQFTLENWDFWLPGFTNQKVNVALPKARIEFSTELSKALKAMGMPEAFGDRANFEKMFADQPGGISRVLQKTYMDINEEGTEAAAVTAVVMMTRALRVEAPPIDFVVDHPYVVALVDKDTREIFFLGSVVNP
ncbi:MAG: serpin family protein [Cyanobacteria bacterium SZAS TMP-1]|nr:serpin family protein [Cyanobacteria bacterium SZAS TMP-1]